MEKELKKLLQTLAQMSTQDIFQRIQEVSTAVGDLVADRVNEAFGSAYASLPSLLAALSEPCAASSVTFRQFITYPADGVPVLRTEVMCTENPADCTVFEIPMAGANWEDPQSWGAALTYFRRISLQTVFNLASAEDDDANAISPVEKKVTEQAKKTRSSRSRAKRAEELQEKAAEAAETAPTLKDKEFENMLASLRVAGTAEDAQDESIMIQENFALSEDQLTKLSETLSQTLKNLENAG